MDASGNASLGVRDSNWWDATREWVRGGLRVPQSQPRIGLALGGGFARGIAHVGVLRAFEKNGIPIHAIGGVSAGAIVAAAFAGGADSYRIEEAALSMKLRDVARWTLNPLGLAGSDRMTVFLARLLPGKRFEDLKMPLAIVATDLCTGRPVVYRDKGDIVLPIRASCAYPGLFLPVEYQNRTLVDGFVAMEVPAPPLRGLGATHVISVAIPNRADDREFGNMLSIINRSFQILSSRTEAEWRRASNLVIEPDVARIGWDSFADARRMIELGERAAMAVIPTVKKWFGNPVPARTEGSSLPATA